MSLVAHYQMFARYNRIANERLYAACALLDESEYRRERAGSLRSIRGLLNHLLLGDRIWMARFEGGGTHTPPLDSLLFEDFAPLREARAAEDDRIEKFFETIDEAFFPGPLQYVNSAGRPYIESTTVAVAHFFNHQTHHRGQVHVMLSQTPTAPPSLDMHRILNP